MDCSAGLEERPHFTFVVMSILLLILGPITILRTPTDIFPNIDIPVVSVIWQYQGLSADQMANRIVSPTERAMTTTVNNIEHVESQSLNGISVVKVFFQPRADVTAAVAQITAVSQDANYGNCRRGRPLRSSSRTTHRAFRFCNWRFRERD